MKIYDTRLSKKVKLRAERENRLRMYTCGPTVYNYAHIGNLRTYVFEDLLRRTILASGMDIEHVMNLTDVDDKTIRGSIAAGVDLKVFTKGFEEAFFEDLRELKIQPAEKYTKATDHIEDMISMIDALLNKGYAYTKEGGSVFYRIAKFKGYGALSHLCLEQLKVGGSNRVDVDEYDKENVSDFVLWKGYDPERDGEVFWQAPWGKGRPGWHIECSAMAIAHLGETIDLHVGGVDNIFPHHENEIAQSEACTGKCFSRHWMHASHLIVNGKKMWKSLGNFYTLRDLLGQGYTGREIRYLLLATHYRTQLNFTFEGLEGAKQTLRRIDDFIERVRQADGPDVFDVHGAINTMKEGFYREMFDDLNISAAMAFVFDFIRKVNSEIDQGQVSQPGGESILKALGELDQVLGVVEKKAIEIPTQVQRLFEQREEARARRDFDRSDVLRKEILELGFVVEDSRSGSCVKPALD